MAVQRVEELLRRVTESLDAHGIRYAVIGGNAVAAWVSSKDEDAIRFTKNVDVLIRRDALSEMARAMEPIGLVLEETWGVTMFVEKVNPSPNRGVHLIFANERIKPSYAHPAPDVTNSARLANRGYAVIDLPALVVMKLQSFRDVDRTHIRDMLRVQLITDDVRRLLPPDMLARLHQIEATPEDTL